MTQSNPSNSSKQRLKALLRAIGICAALVLILISGFTAIQLVRLRSAVSSGDTVAIAQISNSLLPLGRIVAPPAFGDKYLFAPVRLLPELLVQGATIATKLPDLATQQTTGTVDFSVIAPQISAIESNLASLRTNLAAHPQSKQLLEKMSPGIGDKLDTAYTGTMAAKQLLSTNGKLLIMLQNTDELRATGGFMGSYVLLTLRDSVLTEWVVEDIYDADGQFTGFIEAPPGAKEYLSSNRGLRLPDANWSPDFPTSAQHILQFFALGERSDIEAVAAINLTLAEQLLAVLGPIELPDYAATITTENISTELRSQRDEFFAGSVRKKHLLTQLLVQIQLRLAQLSTKQQMQIGQAVQTAANNQDIQVFAIDPQLQNLLQELGVTGELAVEPNTNPVLLIESNVGINKANRGVSRSVAIKKMDQSMMVSIRFTNANLPNALSGLGELTPSAQATTHNGYINYQRLIVRPEWNISAITSNSLPIEIESKRTIKTAAGVELTEYGVLVRVPEQSSTELVFTLQTTDAVASSYPVEFALQSGISSDMATVVVLDE